LGTKEVQLAEEIHQQNLRKIVTMIDVAPSLWNERSNQMQGDIIVPVPLPEPPTQPLAGKSISPSVVVGHK
jgi:hypothetical protein